MAQITITKSFLTYGVGNILYSLITLTLVPFYLEKLEVKDYGILTLFLIAGNLITIFFAMNMSNGILRLFNDKQFQFDKRKVISSIIVFLGIIFSVILTISHIFSDWLSKIIFHDVECRRYIHILITWGIVRVLFQVFQGTLRAINKPALYVLLSITDILLLAGLNIFVIYFTQFSLENVLSSYVYATFGSIILGCVLLRKYLKFSFSYSVIKYLIAYGLPLSVANILSYLINYGNRFFLVYFTNESNVAIFDVSQKISNLVGLLLVNAFLTSFTPYYLNLYNKVDFLTYQQKISKIFFSFTVVFFFVSMFVVVGNDLFLGLLSKSVYLDSSNYVPLLILSNFLYVTFMVTTMGTNILKTTHVEMYVTIIALSASLIFNYVFISWLGLWGAAISQVSINFITVAAMNIYNRKYFPIHWEWGRISQNVFFFSLVSIFYYLFKYYEINITISIVVYLVIFSLYVFWNKLILLQFLNKFKNYLSK